MTARTIPAKSLNQEPKFRYAVLSVRKDQTVAEVESSFVSQSEAERMFDRQYSKWGLLETNFYLVDYETKTILKDHVTF